MKTEFRQLGKFFCLCLLALFVQTSWASAQKLDEGLVPNPVKTSFSRTVPGTQASWSTGIKDQYQAHFNRGGHPYVYVYSKGGALMEKKMVTSKMSLPTAVKGSLEQKYKSLVIEDAYKVLNRNKQKYYEVVIVNTTSKEYLQYGARGNLIASHSEPLRNKPIEVGMADIVEVRETPPPSVEKKISVDETENVSVASTQTVSESQPLMRGEVKEASTAPQLNESDYFNDDDLYDLEDEDEFDEDLDDLLKEDNDDFSGDFDDFDLLEDEEDDDLLDDPGFE